MQAAPDGEAGLARLRAGGIDAVVLDVMMPGVDGFEVVRRLRPDNPLPIIMLTARGDDIDRIVGLDLGADDYLSRPFNPRELLARLQAILRRVAIAGRVERGGDIAELEETFDVLIREVDAPPDDARPVHSPGRHRRVDRSRLG